MASESMTSGNSPRAMTANSVDPCPTDVRDRFQVMGYETHTRSPAAACVGTADALGSLAVERGVELLQLGTQWLGEFVSSGAVQAGTMDAKAFFFGSSDWGNSITVDKPPLSLWILGASVRLFGWSPEAMLAPQAAMGLLTTLIIYLLIRRHFTGTAALIAAAVFATTPIITLMSGTTIRIHSCSSS